MRTQFPTCQQIALGVGYSGNFQVLGLGRIPRARRTTPYLAAWQAPSTGAWMVPSYNALDFAPELDSMVVCKGNSGNLQVIGLADNRIYLAAWQDNKSGTWHEFKNNPLDPDGSWWKAITLGQYQNNLYIVGIGGDDRIWAGPWQRGTTGGWTKEAMLLQNDSFRWKELTLYHETDRHGLRTIGIGLQDQDLYFGPIIEGDNWDKSRTPIRTGKKWLEVYYGISPHDDYVIGLDEDQHSIQKVDIVGSTGSTTRIDPNGGWWKTIRMGNGPNGNLYIVGLGSDDRLYLGPWNDLNGWHGRADQLGQRSWIHITMESDSHGNLQVIGVCKDDSKLYVAAWQDSSGGWYPSHGQNSQSLAQEDDSGRWVNLHLENVLAAFDSIPSSYTAEPVYDCKDLSVPSLPAFAQAHFQGMARYENYYLLTHSTSECTGGPGQIFMLDRIHKKEVMRFNLPEPTRPHPGGCQIVGDYLAVEIEPYSDQSKNPPILRFYWLGTMSDNSEPWLLPAAITIPGALGGAGAIAITSVGAPPNGYIIALRTGNGATFFKITDYLLDDPDLQLGEPIEIKTDFWVESAKEKHGPDNMNLFTDIRGDLFLLTMGGQGIVEDAIAWDWADLYKVYLDEKRLELLDSKVINTSAILHGFQGVHFRYGAGAFVENSSRMMLYGCARNILDIAIPPFHNYKFWTNEFEK